MDKGRFEIVKNEVKHCTRCDLSRTRKNVVFGEGNEKAGILLIAEAPGRDEDLQGRPFMGKSGQLLDKILIACGFKRNVHVYISNVVKCRPPGNRVPNTNEINTCIPYLLSQIEHIDPKIILLLGAIALKHVLGDTYRITRDHGKWINREGRLIIPVYHPSALLRNPSLKKDTWEDYKKVIWKYREVIDPAHYSPHL